MSPMFFVMINFNSLCYQFLFYYFMVILVLFLFYYYYLFIWSHQINCKKKKNKQYDQIRIDDEVLIYVVDTPGCTKDDFQKPVVDRDSNQLSLRGVRIRKFFPVRKSNNQKYEITSIPWEYDRNFPSLVKSGRAQGKKKTNQKSKK